MSCVRCERLVPARRRPLAVDPFPSRLSPMAFGGRHEAAHLRPGPVPRVGRLDDPIHVTVGHLIEVALAKRWGC